MTKDEFLSHVVRASNGCHYWAGEVTEKGYGWFWDEAQGRKVWAHRYAYWLAKGRIPAGHTVDHDCHTRDLGCRGGAGDLHRRCVNPEHLVAVTSKENQELRAARVTHCPKGHEYTPENTMIKDGCRECRRCNRERSREFREAEKATLAVGGWEAEWADEWYRQEVGV